MTPAEGDIIANRFQLIRELGRGSMGSVWLADHLMLEVPCAVKFIAEETVGDPRRLAQFHIEARAIARIQSPSSGVRSTSATPGRTSPAGLLVGETCARASTAWEARCARDLSDRIASSSRLKVHAQSCTDLKPENIFLGQGPMVVKP